MAKEMATEHLSVRILLGSTYQEILDVAEQVTEGNTRWHPAYYLAGTKTNLCPSYMGI